MMETIKKDKEGNPPAEITPDCIIPSRANYPELNSDLGQVHHIFSDKTGTITKNIMNFERLIIGMYEFCKPLSAEQIDADPNAANFKDQLLLQMLQEDSLDG